MPRRLRLWLWNLYPPFLGAGIRITGVAEDWSWIEARLTLRWWNRNYVGTLFGGSIYSLCDPFHMVVLIESLGPAYVVRDKGADIRFRKKGVGTVRARFAVSPAELAEIKNYAEEVQERRFRVEVKDDGGELVAEVEKILHVRRIAPEDQSRRSTPSTV